MSDTVIQWNNIYLSAIRRFEKALASPTRITRIGAMMHAAMYDAINSIAQTHQPYLISLPTPINTSPEAAAAYAAHQVLAAIRLELMATDPTLQTLFSDLKILFDNGLAASLAPIKADATEAEIENGRILGQAIANVVIAKRSKDGSEDMTPYVNGSSPGDWQLTGSGNAVTPNWGKVRPFTMKSGSQFRPVRPGGFATKTEMLQSAEYAVQLNEVKRLGSATAPLSDRSLEQTEIAFFWANDLDGTFKPPGQLYRQTQIVSEQQLLSLGDNARLFALVALALADAGIVAWDAKYSTEIDLWRPETAIQKADTDNNPATDCDESWAPLSVGRDGTHFSPPFPAYVSGHATFGATHAGILRNFFGTDYITFELDTEDPQLKDKFVTRTFDSFSAAALENGRSRVYLGVHFQWDADNGYISGTRLADYVSANFLKPLPVCVGV
ncbi:vanadium-dependent haloperoxidase [Phormidesmis priestleyi]